MKKIINIYKPQGKTPLEMVKVIKETFPEYNDEKIGYAGRLDPLAHGVLLLMIGEETTKQRETYLHLPKDYEFEAAFGVSTDTYDALGIVNNVAMKQLNNNHRDEVEKFIKSKLGKQKQTYPPFSSKTVDGKPLFLWAKENRLSEITIPEREIEIYNFKLIETNNISTNELKTEILKQIESVTGEFRQAEIKEKWEKFFEKYCHFEEAKQREISLGISQPLQGFEMTNQNTFQTARFSISCSSGTYIRSLVNELGNKLATGAITLEILRTEVGEYSLQDSLKLL